jgi:hypothetical protein
MASSESFEDLSPGPTDLPNKTAIDSSNVKEHDVFFWQDGMTTIRVRYDMVIFSSLSSASPPTLGARCTLPHSTLHPHEALGVLQGSTVEQKRG